MSATFPAEAGARLQSIIQWSEFGEGSLRTFLDEWIAYERGAELLTSGGRQIWLNNPCPWVHWYRLAKHMDWHTPAAAEILKRGMERDPAVKKPPRGSPTPFRLIVEHAIPVKVIGEIVRKDPSLRELEALRTLLIFHYKRGVLTSAEDGLLRAKVPGERTGLAARMPIGWKPWDCPFARYTSVGLNRARITGLEDA